jgi:DNA-binding protein
MIMQYSEMIDKVIAEGGFGRDLLESEVGEVILLARDAGALSEAVDVWELRNKMLVLRLAVSDEVNIATQEIHPSMFLKLGDDNTRREQIEYVIDKTREWLLDVKAAAVESRRADWRLVTVGG